MEISIAYVKEIFWHTYLLPENDLVFFNFQELGNFTHCCNTVKSTIL